MPSKSAMRGHYREGEGEWGVVPFQRRCPHEDEGIHGAFEARLTHTQG